MSSHHSSLGAMTASSSAPTFRRSVKDQRAHTTLKFRKFGQASVEEIRGKGGFAANLIKREQEESSKSSRSNSNCVNSNNSSINDIDITDGSSPRLLIKNNAIITSIDEEIRKVASKYDDADIDDAGHNNRYDRGSDSSSDSDSDDGDDDEALLMAELEKIKKERAIAQAKKDEESRQERDKAQLEDALRGNPLMPMAETADSTIKRKWNDDVVFRNQARDEPEVKKRFINDTIRNDFHRMFLKKYMR
jgi:protein CWC15